MIRPADLYDAEGIARPLTPEEERAIRIDRLRQQVKKWESIVDAMIRPNRIRWAKGRLDAFRAELAVLEASAS